MHSVSLSLKRRSNWSSVGFHIIYAHCHFKCGIPQCNGKTNRGTYNRIWFQSDSGCSLLISRALNSRLFTNAPSLIDTATALHEYLWSFFGVVSHQNCVCCFLFLIWWESHLEWLSLFYITHFMQSFRINYHANCKKLHYHFFLSFCLRSVFFAVSVKSFTDTELKGFSSWRKFFGRPIIPLFRDRKEENPLYVYSEFVLQEANKTCKLSEYIYIHVEFIVVDGKCKSKCCTGKVFKWRGCEPRKHHKIVCLFRAPCNSYYGLNVTNFKNIYCHMSSHSKQANGNTHTTLTHRHTFSAPRQI